MADVKGDLSGISQPGTPKPALLKRAEKIGLEPYTFHGFPTVFWDVFGVEGHPMRATISDMGPLLLSRLLELNDTQEGVLNIAFKVADEHGMALLDLKDLRALMTFVAEQSQELTAIYGNVSKSSVGAIQRRLLQLEQEGGDQFFGEPALELADLMRSNCLKSYRKSATPTNPNSCSFSTKRTCCLMMPRKHFYKKLNRWYG